MPNLLNRSKHEEFELNLALQIKIQKERISEKVGKSSTSQKGAKISHHCANFFFCPPPFLTNFCNFSQINPFVIVLVHIIW